MHLSIPNRRWVALITILAGLMLVSGLSLLPILHATTMTASLETETGNITSPAKTITDSSASDGSGIEFGTSTGTHTADCGWASPPSHYKHVIWIWMENKDESTVIGNAPYIDSVKSACGSATNVQDTATSPALPSEPQYAAATSGSNCDTGIDTTGTNCITTDSDYGSSNSLTTTSIFELASSSGDSWKSYQETMPSNCDLTSSGLYAFKHNPAAFYPNIHSDCAINDVGFTGITCNTTVSEPCSTPSGNFYNDIKSGSLPTFSFVTPNLNNDMHNGTIIEADNWLSTYLPIITSGPNYQAGNTAIFIMWDEGSTNNTTSPADIPNLIISPSIQPGTTTNIQTNNIGLLHTTEEMLGLTPYLGCASGTPPGSVGTCGPGSDASLRSALNL